MSSLKDDNFQRWIQHRRRDPAPDRTFTAAVMDEVTAEGEPRELSSSPPHSAPIPHPLLTSFCFCAGSGKLTLIIHLAF